VFSRPVEIIVSRHYQLHGYQARLMGYGIEDLLHLFDLETIEVNIYRGRNRDIGTGRIFGGQVLAQALIAAQRTVEPGRFAHSMHGYFILPGDLDAPVVYFVDTLRDGRSFTTRRVTAIQHGRAIFNMSASFHVMEEGLEHQAAIPTVQQPEELEDELDLIRGIEARIPEPLRKVMLQDRPIDWRPVDPLDPFEPEPRPPVRHMWLRAIGKIPDDLTSQQAVLAYASDYGILATALAPHGLSVRTPGMQAASLDHAIWFHRPFRVDQWLLHSMESPAAAGARGFARGSIYTRDGALVASVAQEGLIRMRR
jgi:acyl-CoA thioesterase-2